MTFPQRLARCAALVESRLEELLSDPAAGGVSRRLAEAMRYAALGGGKRLRPFLVIESARVCGLSDEQAVDAACAVELVHCYSLVHDDLPAMDDDALRRGRPTVHIRFDEATAILAGDALLTLAFEVLARPETHPDAEVRAELVAGLARAAGAAGMVGGQSLDLEAERRPAAESLRIEYVRAIQENKTGALITFAAQAGAVLARTGEQERRALTAYGQALGAAFQIADDLLDIEGSAAVVGKATGKDAAAGKATFVAALGLDGARRRLSELEEDAIRALAPLGEEASMLKAAVAFVARRSR
jgi:farnesyl diphosphate synthase